MAKHSETRSLGEMREQEKQLRKELMEKRFEHATGKLLDTAKLKTLRKELARLLTAVNAKIRESA